MKVRALFFIMIMAFVMFQFSVAQTRNITLRLSDVPFETVLNQIEIQSGYSFLYNKSLVEVSRRTSVDVREKTIIETLDAVFRNTDITYTLLGKQIVLSRNEEKSVAQQEMVTITGKVLYRSEGHTEDLIGASVYQRHTANGTVTDIQGRFSITVPEHSEMVVSYLGVPKYFKVVPGKLHYNMVVEESTYTLSDVLIIGYGVQEKRLVTGATVQVSGDNIRKLSTTNIFNALQSQTPGVSIIQRSGMPGEGFNMIIRGIGTNGNPAPLFVVDGVAGASLNMLNPADIGSIDILKDAASAAIYGSRAANGVVLITTRQARSGKPDFSYDGFYGVQQLARRVKLLNAGQYMEIMNLVAEADGISTNNYQSLMPKQYALFERGEWNGTDWLRETTRSNAPTQSHAINATVGNETSRLGVGLSMVSQEGVLGRPSPPRYNRTNFRVNSEIILWQQGERERWKIGENFTYSYHERNSRMNIGSQWNSDLRNILAASPLLPAYNSKGKLYLYEDMVADNWHVDVSTANPLAYMDLIRRNNLTKGYDLQGNVYMTFSPAKGLNVRSNFGYKMSALSNRSYSPAYKIADKEENVSDDVSQVMDTGWSWTLDNTINYQTTIDRHRVDILVGQSLEKWGYGESLSAKNSYSIFSGSFDHAWLDNTQGVSPEETTVGGHPFVGGALSSFFGRITYDFDQRYMLTAVLRMDGSSNFARGKRWGYFPSLSAGWVFSDGWKLRASWGQNGNSAIENFQYLATISFDKDNGYYFNDDKRNFATSAYPDIMANPNLTWETSEQVDVGLDATLLSHRLRVSIDLYQKKTKDWLVRAPTLTSFGTNAPLVNGGDIRNRGFELVANWNERIHNFRYEAMLSISGNQNRVTRLANSEGILYGPENVLSHNTGRLYQAKVGYPIGYFYGYRTDGIFQHQREIDAMKGAVLQIDPQPGDVRFVDMNRDGKIDPEDKTMIGNPHPDFLLGFNLELEYRGLDFSINGSGAFGQQIAKSYRGYANMPQENYTTDVYDFWTGEGSTNSRPRLTSGRHTNWKEISDLLLEDADYVKLRNITVGYDFKHLYPNMPLERARLYFSIQNAYTWTGYSGMDPEVGYNAGDSWASGIDLGFYPSPRTFLVGCNLKF